MERKGANKKVILAAVILVILMGTAFVLYMVFKPGASQGSKEITVTVVDDTGKKTKYESRTDAEYLRGALEEIKELKIEGSEDMYGLYIKKINGVTAIYEENGAYWAFYINGAYCNYSVEEQPVNDGDAFEIVYEAGE